MGELKADFAGDVAVDFVVVTAIEVERRAICAGFQIGDRDRISKESRVYWRKSIDLNHGEFYNLIVAQSPDMAGVDAAVLVSDILHHWHPAAILLVGIAAGVNPDKQQLGDVVIGRDIYYYERGKLTPTGKQPEPIMYRADATLLNHVQALPEWSLPPNLLSPDGTPTQPKIHYGVIASGEKVIADSAVRDEITASDRKIAAIEMEGYGFSAASWQSFDRVRHLVIKALCDFGDASKGDRWQAYAAAVAADFTKHFLLDRPLEPRNPPRRAMPTPGQYKPIIDELKFGNIVPFLGPGINPNFYIQLASHLTESIEADLPQEPNQNAAGRNLIQRLIGVPCQICHYLPDERPQQCPMLQGIERADNCPVYLEQRLAVAKTNLRYLSQYYKLINNLDTFYDKLYEILESLESGRRPNPVHCFWAGLPHQMLAKNYPRSCPGLPYQLIVTTNCDNLLEQAFDQAQQPYDVIYYVADGSDRGKYKHWRYQSQTAQIIDDPQNYDDQLPLRRAGGTMGIREQHSSYPIILKLYGTQENRFVVTEDHLNSLVGSPIKNLPSGLKRILGEAGILFLGYSPNDSDLQQLVNWLWPDQKLPSVSRLVHQSDPGDLEKKIWKDQRNVELLSIACTPEEFVASLQQELEGLKPRVVEPMR
ncbi:SIR2 family protein [Alkalinema sp. FACHB-956]|uniref:phosphorylase family protein n=1 Tax=Alkalinema sp. FACHB-956 TaxID=2692768 RepID=UPI001689292E|nr:SIR2 family protein [Alkalinema sp. FACHB-956]MBD2328839.1 SIR2 family protein [Alkalinema sp. FACHB-956]